MKTKRLLREAIRAGAAGYILKHAAEDELISAINMVQMGDIYIQPRMVRSLLVEPQKQIPPSPRPEEIAHPAQSWMC